MSDDDNTQVDQHGLTPADHDAIVQWWRGTQHKGVWYQQQKIKNRPLRNSFTLPHDVVLQLGNGDPHTAGMVLAGMFSITPPAEGDDPSVIDGDVVAHIGGGSLAKGRKVLERFVRMVRHGARDDAIEQPDQNSPSRVIR
jgi:hypothetical protein